ncbi:MAG: glycosyltransferase family 4 protein [Patescibacteria group bacterium]
MKSLILYAYPPEPDGLSLQGDMLYRGMQENGEEVYPVHLASEFQKEWLYGHVNPDVAIGVGYWNYTPDIIWHPLRFGVTPVPWLVADGWVANYHEDLEKLGLVLTTSDWVRETYARDGVGTKNFATAHIGIDTENVFRPIPKSDPRIRRVRAMLGVDEGETMILTVGGDVTSKGAQEVLQALKKMGGAFGPWKYVCKIWGGGSADDHYRDEMRLIEELGAAKEKVRYVEGSLAPDFMPYLLNAADIYAAPSRLEGFGMIQVEAQACGIPVISIDAMGPKETIKHGETGFLARVASTVELTQERATTHMGFETDRTVVFEKPKIFGYRADTDEVAEHLLRFLSDSSLREKMGNAARTHAVQNFDYRVTSKKIAALIKERLGIV